MESKVLLLCLSRSKSTNRIVDLRKVFAYRNETGTQLKQFVEHRATLHRLTLLSVTYQSMHMNASVNFVLLSLSKVEDDCTYAHLKITKKYFF